MAYGDNTIGANHQWTFDNVLTDSIGGLILTNTGGALPISPVCRDVSNCYQTNGRDDRAFATPVTTSGNDVNTRLGVGGWFRVSQIQGPPVLIYKQGGTNGLGLFMWSGNTLTAQVIIGGVPYQIYSNIALSDNRNYHFYMYFSGSGFDDEFKFWIDGVLQGTINHGQANIPAHTGEHSFGENGSTGTDMTTGTESVLTKACINGHYNQWWLHQNVSITDSDVKDIMVAQGAIPEYTITSGTESAMQAQIDALNNTVCGDFPLSILVEQVTGDGDLNLSANNITFNSKASFHVYYEGNGTLSWTNTNGSSASLSSGNVVFFNPATLSLNNLIIGTEVRIYDNNGIDENDLGTELSGVESNSGTAFEFNHSGLVNEIVVQLIADGYFEILQKITLSEKNQTFSFIQEQDNNT